MTDDAGSKELEHVESALKKAGASEKCPFCGNTDWALAGEGRSYFALPSLNVAASPPQIFGFAPVYVMFCTQCGFMRAHARSILDQAGKSDEPQTGS